jgi:hypothetical protein
VYQCSEHSGLGQCYAPRAGLGHNKRMPATNEPMPPRRLQLKLVAPSATPEEAAAVVAALERFMRATAPAAAPAQKRFDPWQRAAILEGVERDSRADVSHPWINT